MNGTELLARCADLKGELVTFACGPRYGKALDARRRSAEAENGRRQDEHETITLVDRFILQERQEDGRTILEAFVATHRPLSADERTMLLGWAEVVEGCFEVRRATVGGDGQGIGASQETLLLNLFDGLPYCAQATRGRETFDDMPDGTFVLGRLVPLAPFSDDWLVSGHLAVFDASAGQGIAQGAYQALSVQPSLMRRNPGLWAQAWALQAAAHASFVELHGAEMLILPPEKAQEALRQHYEFLLATGVAADPSTGERAPAVPPEEAGLFPDDVLAADDVAVLYDEKEGLVLCAGVGRLDELFADPALAKDRRRIALLGELLRDDNVPPIVLHHLVRRNPAGAEAAFRALLGRPGFSWERDAEKLLRRYKPMFFDLEPSPCYPVLSERLRELLGDTRLSGSQA